MWVLLLAVASATAEVRLGCEVLVAGGFKELRGKRVALITNQTGVNREGRRTADVLRSAKDVKLMALMAPEHGLDGKTPAGKEFPDSRDPRTGLPVFSLYGPGPTRQPTRAMLKGLDAVVYDVQDIGCRSYTFISTLGQAMDACGAAGVEFVVLDRPNPLGGVRVEGPMLERPFRSFVSRWNVPYVYGLTCGELARMINGERWITNRCRLTVVPMQGWRRTMTWRDTGLPWVPTSPNVPLAESPLYLVATGLLGEIGTVSTGLGSAFPFQCIAAPWLDAEKTCQRLGNYRLAGVKFTPVSFTPDRGAFKGQHVSGARMRFYEPARAPLVALNFYAFETARQLGRRDLFAEAVRQGRSFTMFDKVCGTDTIRQALEAGRPASSIVAAWRSGEEAFRQKRAPYLLYR